LRFRTNALWVGTGNRRVRTMPQNVSMDRSRDLVLIGELAQQCEDSLLAGAQARSDDFGSQRFRRCRKEFDDPCLRGIPLLPGCGVLGGGNQPEAGSIAGIFGVDQLECQGT